MSSLAAPLKGGGAHGVCEWLRALAESREMSRDLGDASIQVDPTVTACRPALPGTVSTGCRCVLSLSGRNSSEWDTVVCRVPHAQLEEVFTIFRICVLLAR